MQVILLEDVKNVGKKNEIVKVSDGYARNFILKKRLGVEATGQNLNELNKKLEKEQEQLKQLLEEAKQKKKDIENLSIKLSIKVGEGGKSFGSISAKEISDAMMEQHKVEIDKRKLLLDSPIKGVGTTEVKVKLHPEVVAMLKVIVEEE